MAANQPLVSVLMTNYNNGGYIRQAVNSVADQTYANIELILVDDGSTDGSASIIESLVSTHKNRFVDFKTYLQKLNAGTNAALNTGIKYVNGEITVVFDSDDVLFPVYVKKSVDVLISQMEKNSNIVGVYPNPILIDGNGSIITEAYSVIV